MRLFLIPFFMLLFFQLSAQDTLTIHPRAAGVDAFFFNRFLPLDNDIGINSPYLFSFRKYKSDTKFTHQGLNLFLRGEFEDNSDDPNQSINWWNIDYRLGSGKIWNVHPKVDMYGGCDWLLGVDFRHTKTDIDSAPFQLEGTNKLTSLTFDTGVGPFVGVQFRISPRFAIYTEAAFYLTFEYEIEKFETDVSNQDNFENKTFRYGRSFRLPGNITLFYYL